jgi:hypothetical protein
MQRRMRPPLGKYLLAIAGLAALLGSPIQVAAQSLGSAESFAILGGSAVNANGSGSVINGDVGVSPGTSITGFPANATITPPFTTHVNDGLAIAAQTSVTALYGSLAAAGPCTPLAAQLDTVSVGPGIYCFTSTADIAANGTFTLDGAGTYIFQVGSSLTANTLSNMVLINGADPCDVFWQITAAATLNGSTFAGNVVAQAAVDLGAGTMILPVALIGRALTTSAGAVTLAGFNTIGGCSVPATPTATSTATSTATGTATETPTASATATDTATETPTASATATATETPTGTATETPTESATATATATETPTASATATATETPTGTATETPTESATATATATETPTASATATATETPTGTATETPTESATATATATETPTESATATATETPTGTATETPTALATATATATETPTASATATETAVATPTETETATATATVTSTASQTVTPTDTSIPTATRTAGPPLLTIQKTSSASVDPGETLVYTLTYKNVGGSIATSILLTEIVPDHTTFNSAASTAGWSCPDGSPPATVCTLSVPDLPAGGQGIAQFAVTVDDPTDTTAIRNTVVIGATEGGGAAAGATTLVGASPAPALDFWGFVATGLILFGVALRAVRRRQPG